MASDQFFMRAASRNMTLLKHNNLVRLDDGR